MVNGIGLPTRVNSFSATMRNRSRIHAESLIPAIVAASSNPFFSPGSSRSKKVSLFFSSEPNGGRPRLAFLVFIPGLYIGKFQKTSKEDLFFDLFDIHLIAQGQLHNGDEMCEAREQRGRAIAEVCTIQKVGKLWRVPSQSGNGTYSVSLEREFCTCPDHTDTGVVCKHMHAVRLVVTRTETQSDGTKTVSTLTVERKTYQQANWSAYNSGQVNEHRHFMRLLSDLCGTLTTPAPKPGKRPILPSDAAFTSIFKTYSTMSSRRFTGDLDEALDNGYVSKVPHFNTASKFFDTEEATGILTDFVTKSAAPMIGLESQFAIDGTGFSGARYEKWFDEKHGVPKSRATWVKLHAVVGTHTNVVAACVVTEKEQNDSPMLPQLVAEAAKHFNVKELSADKAYCGRDNFAATDSIGADFYPAFKKNATGAVGGSYAKAFHAFMMNKEDYESHYHRRSNVESTFSALKRKFGESVRSKNDLSMKNEVLAKVVCHNITTVIGTAYELGIAPMIGLGASCTQSNNPAPKFNLIG